jgi:hypothetical protein
MWEIDVVCSDPSCAEEFHLWVDDLAEIDEAVCACECAVVVLLIARHEPAVLVAVA